MQRVRHLGTLSPKWDLSMKFLPSGLRRKKSCRREGGKNVRAREEEWKAPRKQGSIDELTETEAA